MNSCILYGLHQANLWFRAAILWVLLSLPAQSSPPTLGSTHGVCSCACGNRRAHAGGTSAEPYQAGPTSRSNSPRPEDAARIDPKRPQSHRFAPDQDRTFSFRLLRQGEGCGKRSCRRSCPLR